jgi:hypothetical protein
LSNTYATHGSCGSGMTIEKVPEKMHAVAIMRGKAWRYCMRARGRKLN